MCLGDSLPSKIRVPLWVTNITEHCGSQVHQILETPAGLHTLPIVGIMPESPTQQVGCWEQQRMCLGNESLGDVQVADLKTTVNREESKCLDYPGTSRNCLENNLHQTTEL